MSEAIAISCQQLLSFLAFNVHTSEPYSKAENSADFVKFQKFLCISSYFFFTEEVCLLFISSFTLHGLDMFVSFSQQVCLSLLWSANVSSPSFSVDNEMYFFEDLFHPSFLHETSIHSCMDLFLRLYHRCHIQLFSYCFIIYVIYFRSSFNFSRKFHFNS